MATSADVPTRYDLVIGDKGYVLADNWTGGDTSNAPQKAIHSFTPAFVPRSNVQGNYGDDQQEFWLTFSQKDWSLGEGQKHQGRDEQARRRYWRGSSADVSTPGEVSIRPLVDVLDFSAGAPEAMSYMASQSAIAIGSGTNLYTVVADGTITDEGAHGLGNSPARWGMCSDGPDLYMTTEGASTVGVRKWDGTSFTTFSSTASSAIVALNNALYGLDKDGILRRYSTTGVATTLFTWQGVDGTALQLGTTSRLMPFGGKLLILLKPNGPQNAELWIYDGVGTSMLHKFSANFVPHGIDVLEGIAFIGGYLKRSSSEFKPAIYYYSGGQIGKLWEAEVYGTSTGGPDLAVFDSKLVFTDSTTERLMLYSPETGGVSSIGSYSASEDIDQMVSAADSFLIVTHGGGTGFQTPALVQSNAIWHTSPTSPKAISWPAPTTAGNTLLLAVYHNDPNSETLVTTPTGWTLVHAEDSLDNTDKLYLYKIVGASSRSGAQSVAWTSGPATVVGLQLFEYSGTGVEDVTAAGDTGGGGSSAVATGSTSTTTQDDELWFSVVYWAHTTATISSPSNDFELIRQDAGGTSNSDHLAAFDVVVEATGAASLEATLSANAIWRALVATFKAKAVGEGYLFPSNEKAPGGTVTSSRLDFDSSLDKIFRGIKVDYTEATDGDGGSVDIAYRVGDVEGDYTTLREDAVSGTEYAIGDADDPVTGRSISIRITLNKGTSTAGPLLKRIYVRAVPVGNNFHRAMHHLAAWGKNGENHVKLRNGQEETRTGQQIAMDLMEAAESQTPLSVTDRFGTRTSIVEQCELFEAHPGEYTARVTVREI